MRKACGVLLAIQFALLAAGCGQQDDNWQQVAELRGCMVVSGAHRDTDAITLLFGNRDGSPHSLRIDRRTRSATIKPQGRRSLHLLADGRALAIDPATNELRIIDAIEDVGEWPPGKREILSESESISSDRVVALGVFTKDRGPDTEEALLIDTKSLEVVARVSLEGAYTLQTNQTGGVWIRPRSGSNPIFEATETGIRQVRNTACTVHNPCFGIDAVLPSGELVCNDDFFYSKSLLISERRIRLPAERNNIMPSYLLGEVFVYWEEDGIGWVNLSDGNTGFHNAPGRPALASLEGDPTTLVACTDRGYVALIHEINGKAALRPIAD